MIEDFMFNFFKKTTPPIKIKRASPKNYVGICSTCKFEFEDETNKLVCPECHQIPSLIYKIIESLTKQRPVTYRHYCNECKTRFRYEKEIEKCPSCKKPFSHIAQSRRCCFNYGS